MSGICVCNCLTYESSFNLVPLSVVGSIIRNKFQDKYPTSVWQGFSAFHTLLPISFRSRKSHRIQMRWRENHHCGRHVFHRERDWPILHGQYHGKSTVPKHLVPGDQENYIVELTKEKWALEIFKTNKVKIPGRVLFLCLRLKKMLRSWYSDNLCYNALQPHVVNRWMLHCHEGNTSATWHLRIQINRTPTITVVLRFVDTDRERERNLLFCVSGGWLKRM